MGNSDSAPSRGGEEGERTPSSPGSGAGDDAQPSSPRISPEKPKGRSVDVDITVYGATGFVGRHVCEYLIRSAALSSGGSKEKEKEEELGAPTSVVNPEDDDTDYDSARVAGAADSFDEGAAVPADGKAEQQQHLSLSGDKIGRPLRITLAGRCQSKLEATKSKLRSHPDFKPDAITIDTFVADADDVEALTRMAQRTTVVLNCAGPFAKYGTNVVGACASTGADYVDITGEVGWAGDMRARFGKEAEESGSRIISFCGFDSVPSDLAVYAAVRALRDGREKKQSEGGDEGEDKYLQPLNIFQAKTWHSCFGLLNGGTLHSALGIPVDVHRMLFEEEEEAASTDAAARKKKLRNVPHLIDHPFHLADPKVRDDVAFDHWRDSAAAAEWLNQLPSVDTELSDSGVTVSAPFFMAVVNAKVVHASAIALGYCNPPTKDGNGGEGSGEGGKAPEAFTYWERFLPGGFALTQSLGFLSAIPAVSYGMVLAVVMATFKAPIVGEKLANWLLPPGSGVPDHINGMGYATVYAEALAPAAAAAAASSSSEGASSGDTSTPGHVDRGTCRLSFEGDPGNLVTAQCVGEAALCLVHDRDDLPPRSDDGFGTPAQLLGDALIARLLGSRVRKVTMETGMVENDRRYKWERYGGALALVGAVGLALRAWW